MCERDSATSAMASRQWASANLTFLSAASARAIALLRLASTAGLDESELFDDEDITHTQHTHTTRLTSLGLTCDFITQFDAFLTSLRHDGGYTACMNS
jgi:hypothetical protein